MKMKRVFSATLVVLAGMHGGFASAASVACAGGPGELRVLTIDPALVGGLCLTQEGNFSPAQGVTAIGGATGLTTVHLDKDENGDAANPNDAWLTGFSAGTSGNWTVSDDPWNIYQRLFLGFHFGNNNGAGNAGDPDSFFVELSRSDNAGTWVLAGAGAALNDLSHIDLFGAGSCAANPNACGGGVIISVPEPTAPALVGLALLALALVRRRA